MVNVGETKVVGVPAYIVLLPPLSNPQVTWYPARPLPPVSLEAAQENTGLGLEADEVEYGLPGVVGGVVSPDSEVAVFVSTVVGVL